MKTIIVMLMVMIVTIANFFAQNRSINFEQGSLQKTLEKAKTENKLIFIDVYTAWCGPCKKMDKLVFTNDTVADFFNQYFVSIKKI